LSSFSSGSWVVPTAITGISTALASGRTLAFNNGKELIMHGVPQASPDYLSVCAAQAPRVGRPKLGSKKRSRCGIPFTPCVAHSIPAAAGHQEYAAPVPPGSWFGESRSSPIRLSA
jgi:hypothetical protein